MWPLDRQGRENRAVERMVRTVVAGAAGVEQLAEDRDGLLQPVDPLTRRPPGQPQHGRVEGGAAGPDPELEAALRDVIDRHRHPGKERRIAQGDARDERAEPHGRGRRREAREERPALQPGSGRGVRVDEVVGDPDGVESHPLGAPGTLPKHGPRGVLEDENPEPAAPRISGHPAIARLLVHRTPVAVRPHARSAHSRVSAASRSARNGRAPSLSSTRRASSAAVTASGSVDPRSVAMSIATSAASNATPRSMRPRRAWP